MMIVLLNKIALTAGAFSFIFLLIYCTSEFRTKIQKVSHNLMVISLITMFISCVLAIWIT